jgi:predicted RNA binding protein YcfA (HicA-like mRNA interferase family)
MNPSLPVVSGAEAVRVLMRAGFLLAGQRGSHVKMRHEDGRVATVPMHRELVPEFAAERWAEDNARRSLLTGSAPPIALH